MNLIKLIEAYSNGKRYKTDVSGIEYSILSNGEQKLLDSFGTNVRRLLSPSSNSVGFNHPPFLPIPVRVTIRTRLSQELKQLLIRDLSNPVLEFEYQGNIVDLQILQSVGILPYQDAYGIFDVCSSIADCMRGQATLITPVLSYTSSGDIVLYRLPEENVV